MSIDVTGVKWRATTIRIDRLGDLSGLRRGDWNQKCDYLMVIHKGTTYHATFLELKKSLDEGAPKPLEQLRRFCRSWNTCARFAASTSRMLLRQISMCATR